MRTPPLLAFLSALMASTPSPAEDAVHRADRLRTEQLNRDAARDVARRERHNAGIRNGAAEARLRYQRDLADWRRRVADCRAGRYAACD